MYPVTFPSLYSTPTPKANPFLRPIRALITKPVRTLSKTRLSTGYLTDAPRSFIHYQHRRTTHRIVKNPQFVLYCERRLQITDDDILDNRGEDDDDEDPGEVDLRSVIATKDEQRHVNNFPRHSALPFVKRLCFKVYADIYNRNFDRAKLLMEEARSRIQICAEKNYLKPCYFDGMNYVVDNLEFYSNFVIDGRTWTAEQLNECMAHMRSYDGLTNESKAFILSIKYELFRHVCPKSYQEQIEISRLMIELDPTSPKWYLNLYHPTEKMRRETVPFIRHMSETEIAAITAAFDCPGASFEPSVVIIYLQCLAQMVHDARYPFQFGSVQFETPQEIVRYIRTQAERLCAVDPLYSATTAGVGKIFSRLLPRPLQDVTLALVWSKQGLIFRPHCVRTNDRLASIYIKMQNYKKALVHARITFEKKSNQCFYAALDGLYILLRDALNTAQDFDQLYDEAINSPSLASFRGMRSGLLFVKAIREYLLGNYEDAASNFLEAMENDREAVKQELRNIIRFNLEAQSGAVNNINDLKNFFRFQAEQGGWNGPARRLFGELSCMTPHRFNCEADQGIPHQNLNQHNIELPAAYASFNLQPGAREAEVNEAYASAVRSYDPESLRNLPEPERSEEVERMKNINRCWEAIQMQFLAQ